MKSLFLILFSFVFFVPNIGISYSLGLAKVTNGYVQNKNDPKKIEISIVDMNSAINLFNKMSRQPDLSFNYPHDGCYARATAMTRVAESENIIMGRVNAEGDLHVKTGIKDYPSASWGWHVAPFVLVKNSKGKLITMVFDPLLFKAPVELTVWLKKMLEKTSDFKPKINKVYFGNRFQYFKRRTGKCNHNCRFQEDYRSQPFSDEELGNYAVVPKLREIQSIRKKDLSNNITTKERKSTEANP